jgi:hypothetical protein
MAALRWKTYGDHHTLGEVYSCLQKALRRGEVGVAVYAARAAGLPYPHLLLKRVLYFLAEDCPCVDAIARVASLKKDDTDLLKKLLPFVVAVAPLPKTHATAFLNRVACFDLCTRYCDAPPSLSLDAAIEQGNVRLAAVHVVVASLQKSTVELLFTKLTPKHAAGLFAAWKVLGDINHGRLLLFAALLLRMGVFPPSLCDKLELAPLSAEHAALTQARQVLPDWVYDKHTATGKARGRGYAHFLEVSLQVNKPLFPGGDPFSKEASACYNESELGVHKSVVLVGLWQESQRKKGINPGKSVMSPAELQRKVASAKKRTTVVLLPAPSPSPQPAAAVPEPPASELAAPDERVPETPEFGEPPEDDPVFESSDGVLLVDPSTPVRRAAAPNPSSPRTPAPEFPTKESFYSPLTPARTSAVKRPAAGPLLSPPKSFRTQLPSVWSVYSHPLQAQPRTARWKPPVYFVCSARGQKVVKGPVSEDIARQTMLTEEVKWRLGLHHANMHRETYSEGVYLVADALVPYDPNEYLVRTTKIEQVKLVVAPPLSWNHAMLVQNDDLAVELFAVLAFRRCVGTNDTCPRNILVVPRPDGGHTLYSIDDPTKLTPAKFMWSKSMFQSLYDLTLTRVWDRVQARVATWERKIDSIPPGVRGYFAQSLSELKHRSAWHF